MNKTMLLYVAIIAVILALFLNGKYLPTKIKDIDTPSSSPIVKQKVQDDGLESAVIREIALKYNISPKALAVFVSGIEGDYAKGTINTPGSAGLWLAARVEGEWKLIWDGNGIVKCSELNDYPHLPNSLAPSCWDPAKDRILKR